MPPKSIVLVASLQPADEGRPRAGHQSRHRAAAAAHSSEIIRHLWDLCKKTARVFPFTMHMIDRGLTCR